MKNSLIKIDLWPVNQGETLSIDQKAARMLCLKKIFRTGNSIGLVDDFREEFEHYHKSKMTSSSNMRTYLPVLLTTQDHEFNKFLSHKLLSIIFDGADFFFNQVLPVWIVFIHKSSISTMSFTYLIRTVDVNWNIDQKLVKLTHSNTSIDHKVLNSMILNCFRDLGLSFDQLRSATTDSHSVNILSLKWLGGLARQLIPMECYCHILNRVGGELDDPGDLVLLVSIAGDPIVGNQLHCCGSI